MFSTIKGTRGADVADGSDEWADPRGANGRVLERATRAGEVSCGYAGTMASAAYKPATSGGWQFVLIVLVGLVVGLAIIMFSIGNKTNGPVAFGLFLVCFVGALATGWWVVRSIYRRRVSAITQRLVAEGFLLDPKPSTEAKAACFQPLAEALAWSGIHKGADFVLWIATPAASADGPCLFEHEYVVGSGRTSREITHTVIVWPGRADWPGLVLARRGRTMRWLERRQGLQDIEIGSPEFDSLWRISGSEALARKVLSPAVIDLLASSPAGETWAFNAGHVCCVFHRQVGPQSLVAMLERSRMLMGHLERSS